MHPIIQEYNRFKRFSDSLLARSGKLSELVSDLEREVDESEKGEESSEVKRVRKSHGQIVGK